jgi:hypothetical protein
VALFVASAAFAEPGPIQDSIKMGALGSFLAAGLAWPTARLLGVRQVTDEGAPSPSPDTISAEIS